MAKSRVVRVVAASRMRPTGWLVLLAAGMAGGGCGEGAPSEGSGIKSRIRATGAQTITASMTLSKAPPRLRHEYTFIPVTVRE
jgi:hypothetical protein